MGEVFSQIRRFLLQNFACFKKNQCGMAENLSRRRLMPVDTGFKIVSP